MIASGSGPSSVCLWSVISLGGKRRNGPIRTPFTFSASLRESIEKQLGDLELVLARRRQTIA
jgi:hypothetical protein